jgi:alpha-tubulin suppressor-like RCC1 family protein
MPSEDGMGGYDEPTATYLTSALYIASDVTRVAVGRNDDGYGNHICYIESSGDSDKVYCQGSQLFGMLGDGVVPDLADDVIDSYLGAGYVTTLPAQGYVDISAGSAHTCVVSDTGELYCWGFSSQGQTGGDSYYEQDRGFPAQVTGFPTNSKVVSVSAGLMHTCAIVAQEDDADDSDGDVYCFGSNQHRQLAQTNTTGICEDVYTGQNIACESAPKKVSFPGSVSGISQVCGGYNYSCAIAEPDGTVYCWGDFYQVGINSVIAAPIPEGTTNTKEIACGMRHACVLSDSGNVTCFGDYELYDSIWEEYVSLAAEDNPLEMFPEQETEEVEHVAAGKKHSCYSSTDPQTQCWGYLNSAVIYDFTWALIGP